MKKLFSLYSGLIKPKLHNYSLIIFLIIINGIINNSHTQTFVKVTDSNNDAATTVTDANYSGAAWIDIDNDGDLDLYTTKNFLFRNVGGGNFEQIDEFTSISANQLGNGTSWGDYDNDGDIDLFLSGKPSIVYRNNGNGSFTPITNGPIGENADNRGWTGAWGDYNSDGFIDLVITHPNGFLGNPGIPSRFFENNGDGGFSQINIFEFTTALAPYTVATWSDYDLDGDYDLFIGSGPVTNAARDYLYNNTFAESGTADFERIMISPIGTDLQDGQVWNWIDYDNDGDLDAMLTNYSSAPNRFYRNDNDSYTSLSNELTLSGAYLGNSWGDIDNDGDLDVLLTNETNTRVYINNGDETFTLESTFSGAARSSSLGDYDNDGDLDMYVTGTGDSRGLYKNEIQNGNSWVIFYLEGTVSNKSAIGTKVKVKATIEGNPVWQFREVSAQNNFNGHNSLRVHFGLGNASTIDSVVFFWPSGSSDIQSNLSINNNYEISESIPSGFLRADFIADKPEGFGVPLTVQFRDISIVDPNSPITSWEWDFDNDGTIDATEQNPEWTFTSVGNFSVKLTVQTAGASKSKIKTDYINVQILPGFPLITFESPAITDTNVTLGTTITFTVSAIDTTGYPLSYTWREDSFLKSSDTLFNYRASAFKPTPRTDTVVVEITNGFNNTFRTWFVNVESATSAEDVLNNLPTEFNLGQNYPNPFNPETKIVYAVPEEVDVKISVYNILGKEVSLLVNEKKAPGFYELNFGGEILPSGVYIYTIEAGQFISSKKMILLK